MTRQATAMSDRRTLRRVRTRARLIDAGRQLIASRGGLDAVPIEEIAVVAGVATGSFYNHFASKGALFEAVVADAARTQGELLDALTSHLDDPAERVGTGLRLTVRTVRDDPVWGGLAVETRIYVDELWAALGHRLERDLGQGVGSGRFSFDDLPTTRAIIAGATLGVLQGVVRGNLPVDAGSRLAEKLLGVLGVPADEAREIASRPLPRAMVPGRGRRRKRAS